MFLGYAFGIKGYKLLDLRPRWCLYLEMWFFYKDNFPYKNKTSDQATRILQPDFVNINFHSHLPPATTLSEIKIKEPKTNHIDLFPPDHIDSSPVHESNTHSSRSCQEQESSHSTIESYQLPHRSSREKKTPIYLEDYIC